MELQHLAGAVVLAQPVVLLEAVQPLAAVEQQPVAALPAQQRKQEWALRQAQQVPLPVRRSPPRPRAHKQ